MKKIKGFMKKIYYRHLKKRLKTQNFTIISNNCFAGILYKDLGIEYKSPTCGLFFMASDFIMFIYDLKKYIDMDIVEISIENSKYSDYLKKIKYDKPIGKIGDIEIFFLHYNTFEEACLKWNRRKKRIVWDNIIYKFNDQNLCTYSDLEKFEKFNAEKKILFTSKEYNNINSIQLKKYKDYEYVLNDTSYKEYKNYIDIFELINR